jgi:hypothetical protein
MAIHHIFQLSPGPPSDTLFESAFHLCHAILSGYNQCSIWRTYQAYFEKKEKVSERITSAEGVNQPMRKRTRRGKRAGQLRPLQHRKAKKYDPSQESMNGSARLPTEPISTLTVGERLLSHTLRNGLLDITLTRDGYESQEDQVPTSVHTSSSPLGKSHSKKRQKRRRSDGQDKLSLDSSTSSSFNESSIPTQVNGPGLQYSVDLRTMRTEVDSPSILSPMTSPFPSLVALRSGSDQTTQVSTPTQLPLPRL